MKLSSLRCHQSYQNSFPASTSCCSTSRPFAIFGYHSRSTPLTQRPHLQPCQARFADGDEPKLSRGLTEEAANYRPGPGRPRFDAISPTETLPKSLEAQLDLAEQAVISKPGSRDPYFVAESGTLPYDMWPTNISEQFHLEAVLVNEKITRRKEEQHYVEDLAWQSHHHQNRNAVNRYSTVRRVAQLMTQIEADDFLLEDKAPRHFSSWARAEIQFSKEFEEFNEFIRETVGDAVKRLPKEAEEEELDIMDDALFLLNRDDDSSNPVNRKLQQQQRDHDVLDAFLDVLPGVSLSNLSESYADEIFSASNEQDDEPASDDPGNPSEDADVGSEGAAE